jgi:hypothetical protein
MSDNYEVTVLKSRIAILLDQLAVAQREGRASVEREATFNPTTAKHHDIDEFYREEIGRAHV